MKLINLFKVNDTIYISAGDGYFPRFGSYPLPTNTDVYKFTNSDKLYVWDGVFLRPSIPEEGDIAYGSDGQIAGQYKDGWWMLSAPLQPLGEDQHVETGKEVHQLRIGNVSFDIDPVQFVADNRELIDAIMEECLSKLITAMTDSLSEKQEYSPKDNTLKDNTLVSIFAKDVTGTAPLDLSSIITGRRTF